MVRVMLKKMHTIKDTHTVSYILLLIVRILILVFNRLLSHFLAHTPIIRDRIYFSSCKAINCMCWYYQN